MLLKADRIFTIGLVLLVLALWLAPFYKPFILLLAPAIPMMIMGLKEFTWVLGLIKEEFQDEVADTEPGAEVIPAWLVVDTGTRSAWRKEQLEKIAAAKDLLAKAGKLNVKV